MERQDLKKLSACIILKDDNKSPKIEIKSILGDISLMSVCLLFL